MGNRRSGADSHHFDRVISLMADIKLNFETPEDLRKAINAHFDGLISFNYKPTVSGMSLAIGIKSWQTLQRFMAQEDDFAEVVREAVARIGGINGS
jgi:hypothetical protein